MKDGVAAFVLKACICCMWCLKNCLRYINRNAYIEINLFGYSFCNAAIQAFKTLLSNFVQVAASSFVGGLVFFTLRILVVSLNMVIAYYWIDGLYTLEAIASGEAAAVTTTVSTSGNEVQFAAPMFIIAVFTYIVMGTFTELLDMTTDTKPP